MSPYLYIFKTLNYIELINTPLTLQKSLQVEKKIFKLIKLFTSYVILYKVNRFRWTGFLSDEAASKQVAMALTNLKGKLNSVWRLLVRENECRTREIQILQNIVRQKQAFVMHSHLVGCCSSVIKNDDSAEMRRW